MRVYSDASWEILRRTWNLIWWIGYLSKADIILKCKIKVICKSYVNRERERERGGGSGERRREGDKKREKWGGERSRGEGEKRERGEKKRGGRRRGMEV